MKFPPYPTCSNDIYSFPGNGEYLACTIVHNCTMRQLMAFKVLRQRMGNRRFLDALAEALDIIARSNGITTPAGWLYWFIKREADACEQVM